MSAASLVLYCSDIFVIMGHSALTLLVGSFDPLNLTQSINVFVVVIVIVNHATLS